MQTPPPLQQPSGALAVTKKIVLAVLPFGIKVLMFILGAVILFGILAGMAQVFSAKIPSEVKVTNLSSQYQDMVQFASDSVGEAYTVPTVAGGKKVFVISFVGDVAASDVSKLRKEVSIVLEVASPTDEVVVLLESGGGYVHSYGLASAQLARIKAAGVPLTIAVDKVAASGGYMMACVADTLVAAPFAIIGSIGVVAEFPNFSGWMSNHGITYEQHTAGKYKRTVSPFTKSTKEATEKTAEDLARTHGLFKKLVTDNRPEIAIEEVATGEIWYGQEAVALNLIDTVCTSDELLISKMSNATLYKLHYVPEAKFSERLAESTSLIAEKLYLKMSSSYLNNW